VQFALGAGARFVARAVDTQAAELVEVLKRAHAHRGASFVEVFQNCVVFNDGVFADFTAKEAVPERQLFVRHGEPLVFGPRKDRGLRLDPRRLALEVVPVGEGGVTAAEVLVHDERNRVLADLLAGMQPPDFPVALGVLYCDPSPTYESGVFGQVDQARATQPAPQVADLLRKGPTWVVD
jgi:2-oxoglutarate ferredoxin oxidoreductase subunit beta